MRNVKKGETNLVKGENGERMKKGKDRVWGQRAGKECGVLRKRKNRRNKSERRQREINIKIHKREYKYKYKYKNTHKYKIK